MRKLSFGCIILISFSFASSDLGGYISLGFKSSELREETEPYNFYIPGLCIENWRNVTSTVNVFIGGEYGCDKEILQTLRVWFGYRLFSHHRVRFGAFYLPFGGYNQFHSPLFDKLVNPPMIVYEIIPTPWVDMGIVVNGEIPLSKNLLLSHTEYIVNGLGEGESIREGRQFLDNNDNKAYGGRFGILSVPNLDIGASWYFGTRDRESKLSIGMLGVDGVLSFFGFELRGENVSSFIDFSYNALEALKTALGNTFIISNWIVDYKPIDRGWAYGNYIQLTYNYKNMFIPAVRYGNMTYRDEFHKIDIDNSRLSLGLGYYHPLPLIFIKIEYDFNKSRSDEIFLQTGISF